MSKGRTEHYIVRFNDHPVFSTMSNLREGDFKSQVEKLKYDFELNEELMFFIEIARENIDLTVSNQLY